MAIGSAGLAEPGGAHMSQRRRSLAPLTGAAFVVLSVVSFTIAGDVPADDAPGNEVISFYADNESSQMISTLLGVLATLFFLFFVGRLRSALREREVGTTGELSAVAFAGGVVAAVGMLIFAGITFTLVEVGKDLEPAAAQALHALYVNLFFPVAGGMVTLLFAAGLVVMRTGALPRWLGWFAILIAILGITPLGFFAFLGSMLWILIVSIVLFLGKGVAQTTAP